MTPIEYVFDCEIGTASIPEVRLKTPLVQGDALSTRFKVRAIEKDGGVPTVVDLTGFTVMGYFMRYDGKTVEINGSIDGDYAVLLLPAKCYDVAGIAQLTMCLTTGTTKLTVLVVNCYVMQSKTGTIIT